MDKKKILIDRVLQTVREYSAAYGRGCPMHILAAKYRRTLERNGIDLYQLVDQFKADGILHVYILKTGGKLVSPELLDGVEGAVKL